MEIIENGGVTSPRGFMAGAASCGLKKKPRQLDIALLASEQDCAAAGLFTRNQVVAAPVILDRETLQTNKAAIRGVVANAGNANACTGAPGLWAARQMQKNAAFALNCHEEQILVLSTGVIGVQLPMTKVNVGIDAAARRLSRQNGGLAAEAIMTTDTRAKQSAVRLPLQGGEVVIGGMAKGSGMIHPNMATMLALICTDADIAPAALQAMLRHAADRSFNRISVDGDTSTNDTVLLLANGASQTPLRSEADEASFLQALTFVCLQLAQMIVRDGEGATRFVTISVGGAPDEEQAHAIANSIATSPLVKTALAGGDANWGRILAAAGRAAVVFDQSAAALWIGSDENPMMQLVDCGTPTDYSETEAAAIFAAGEIVIELQVGAGEGAATVWTCDLTHEYVAINADYRS